MPKQPASRRWLPLVLVAALAIVVWRSELPRQPERIDAHATRSTSEVGRATAAAVATTNPNPVGSVGPSAPTSAAASFSGERALFAFVRPANSAQLSAALPAPAREIHYVRLNPALIAGKHSPFWRSGEAARLEIPMPEGDGPPLVVAIHGSEMLGPNRWTSTGQIENRPASRVLFAWNDGFLHAEIEDPLLGRFALRAATAELTQFYRVDPALVPPCGGERRPRTEAAPRSAAGTTTPSSATSATAAADAAGRVQIDVMMAHTKSVLTTLGGAARSAALQSAFDLAIAKVNSVFAASRITARVRLVRIFETTYDETASKSDKVQDDALTALYRPDDSKMDDVHAARDAAGADIVMLALDRPDFISSGLSFLLDEPGDSDNPRFAFSVVHYSAIGATNVVPHELGHVFGCAHDREHAASGEGAFAFSFGYRFLGGDGRWYHDIMAYPGTPRAMELSYFSNPEITLPTPINARLGIPAGQPGESNNALTIERNAIGTAIYRLQAAANPAGSLVNVATRAFVGTGEQVLIGGFVVNGAQPKRVLVRAAGPALAAFGVADPLVDPVLRIISAGTVAAENDNWNVPVATAGRAAAAAEVTSAASAIGAFPFSAGSADSAMLVTLEPGAYTAVVEGARGTTGVGLIEAYEVDRDATRIINLATRAYADRVGREIHGGFVVQAAPGTTKRILVRALGPTLARAPFNLTDVLDDPEMEIRDGAGDLIVLNDDWSSGAEGGASPDNDFKPLVASLGEKQIFATGHAPQNRREPCIMMDLPPGSYTVTVRPFELRSSNPLRDQPAIPGVAVVEVYSIDR